MVIMLTIICVLLVLFILNTLGKKNETASTETNNSLDTTVTNSTTTSLAITTTQTSSKTEETIPSTSYDKSIDNSFRIIAEDTSKFGIDFSVFENNKVLKGAYKDAQLELSLAADDSINLRVMVPANNITGQRSAGEGNYSIEKTNAEIDIISSNTLTKRTVKVFTKLLNPATVLRDIVGISEFFNDYHLYERQGYLFYNKDGGISLALKRSDNYGFAEISLI